MDVVNHSTVVYFKIAHLGRQPLPISFYHSRLPNTQCAFRFNPAERHQKIDSVDRQTNGERKAYPMMNDALSHRGFSPRRGFI